MLSALTWLDSHAGVITALGILVGAAVAWFVYRSSVSGERKGVLDALRKELELHESWVSTSYVRGHPPVGWWETNPLGIVFKLSTVAIDAAIATGPSLFLNRHLVTALAGYRQRVQDFNQLIDRAMAFQASNSELYRRFPSRRVVARMKHLWGAVHYGGVGHGDENLSGEGQGQANYYYRQVIAELRREENHRIRYFIWLVAGLRFSSRRRHSGVCLSG